MNSDRERQPIYPEHLWGTTHIKPFTGSMRGFYVVRYGKHGYGSSYLHHDGTWQSMAGESGCFETEAQARETIEAANRGGES